MRIPPVGKRDLAVFKYWIQLKSRSNRKFALQGFEVSEHPLAVVRWHNAPDA